MDMPLYTGLSVATGIGHVQHHTGEDTGSDAAKRHRADAGRPELLAGFERRGVYRIPLHRHHRLLTIPTVAGWIIQAGGMGGYGRNVNQMAGRAGSMAGSVAGAAAGNAVGRVGKLLK